MTSNFGRGFITNLFLLAIHFGLPPEQAFYGAADHLDDLIVPKQFEGTEIDTIVEQLRKKILWHSPGMLDKEDAADVLKLINRLALAIDQALGIKDPDIGKFD
ncbi:MAG: hypothetical protein LUO88_04670 [Methanoregulaceae archaeon]|nr:hypothetical protein [Methanoregulaceae archaeon]